MSLFIALTLWDTLVTVVLPVVFAASACFGVGAVIHLLTEE